jgi:regulator of sigma E protease
MDIMEILHKAVVTPYEFVRDYGGPFILVLSILVFVHEFGHYIVARWCGVKVEKFSIGFGKELFGRTDKKGCRWKFCMIPLGGYVQLFGDVDPSQSEPVEGAPQPKVYTAEERKVAFFAQPIRKRAAIVFAGPAINYLFAILILSGLYITQGEPYVPPVAAAIVEDSPAERSGLKLDDKILSVNGEEIQRFDDLRKYTALYLDQTLELKVARYLGKDKKTGEPSWNIKKPVTISVTPRRVVETDRFGFKHEIGRIGIKGPGGDFEMKEHTFFSAIAGSFKTVYSITSDTLKALGQMIIGTRSADELGGILRIGAYAGDFAAQGLIAFITFAALLSVNLGLVNILPIPMLDGGYLAMYAMEKLRGKPLNERIQEYALRVGLVFLLGIMFLATWNDIVQMYNAKSSAAGKATTTSTTTKKK